MSLLVPQGRFLEDLTPNLRLGQQIRVGQVSERHKGILGVVGGWCERRGEQKRVEYHVSCSRWAAADEAEEVQWAQVMGGLVLHVPELTPHSAAHGEPVGVSSRGFHFFGDGVASR